MWSTTTPPRATNSGRRCASAASTMPRYYRLESRRSALLHGLHRHAAIRSNLQHPRVLQLIMDSLRYWVLEMHVDGFRFDLASALARELFEVDRLGSFFDTIGQDPVLSQVKLIAEPWDVGAGGYQVGNFPPGWNEWNDKYRDSVRAYWKGDGGLIGEFAQRFTGSSGSVRGERQQAARQHQLRHRPRRLHAARSRQLQPQAQRGERRGQPRRQRQQPSPGTAAWRGRPMIRRINALRERQKRNLIATLLLSQGVPMLLAGDEIGRTQNGNNNAYCQDNEISWINWKLGKEEQQLYDFVARIIRLRREHPVFSRRRFLQDQSTMADDAKEVMWFAPNGSEMTETEWKQEFARCLGVYFAGTAIRRIDRRGQNVKDMNFLALFNAHHEPIAFALPPLTAGGAWSTVLDTAVAQDPFAGKNYASGAAYALQGRSIALLVESGRD